MKKTRTRILTLLLALVMCAGLLPMTALAANGPNLILGGSGATASYDIDYKTIWYEIPWDGDQGYISITTLSASEYAELAEQYGECTLTRVIQYADGREDVLTDQVIKSQDISFAKPMDRHGRSFGDWCYADGQKFNFRISEDTTIYLTETYNDEFYSVKYDLNGCPTWVQFIDPTVKSGQTITLPKDPVWEGYTFLGWYSGIPKDDVLTYPTQWSNDTPVTADVTLYAMWQKAGVQGDPGVIFHANGGAFSGGAQTLSHVPYSTFPYYTVECPPDPVREGYLFLGWYTEDGELWDQFGSKVTYTLELYAKWGKENCTVTFNVGNAPVTAPAAQTVQYGKTISMPGTLALNGYRFLGWYAEDGTVWNASDPVTDDMTLYAVWDMERFSFSNAPDDFMKTESTTYQITGKYLEALQSGLKPEQWAPVKEQMDEVWHGSCLGMSILYALRSVGRIDPAFFQSNAETLYDLAAPVQSQTVFNLINYYHLQWGRPEIKSTSYSTEKCVAGYYNQELVTTLKTTNQPVVLCFMFGKYYTVQELKSTDIPIPAHAVVALNCEEKSDGTYEILIWDPNQKANDVLTVSRDFQTITFDSEEYLYSRAYRILPVTNCEETFDHLNIQNYLLYGEEAETMETDMTMFDTSLLDYTLAVDNGEYVQFINGVPVKGKLSYEITIIPLGDGTSNTQMILPNGGSYTITTEKDTPGTISMLVGDCYVKVDSAGLTELTVTEDGRITIASSQAARQTVSVTSGELGDTWNSLTVTGTDTGFALNVNEESVTVKSEHDVKVTVTGGNVYSDQTSSQQTVSAASGGVTVSTASGDLTVKEDTTGTNPFTDVPSGAYYYDAVLWAVENNITSGTGDGTAFSPEVKCSRAEAVTFLWRAAGRPEPAATVNPFTDVSEGAYYYKAVLWAVENGITKGTGDGSTFSPAIKCSRAEIVTFLYRAVASPAVSAGSGFSDVSDSAYYANAVTWAVKNGVTTGTGDGTAFSPDVKCSRAEIVTFLYRTYKD